MNGYASRSPVIGCALFIVCAVSTGCDGRMAAQPATAQTRYIVFIDRSLSPGQDQVAFWVTAAETRVFQRLQPGDAVTAYEISDRTADTAPLIDVAIPPSDDAGMEETLRIRRLLANARSEGLEAVKNALRHSTATQTRLLESICRIQKDESRKTFVLYLTDALESSPELDLERTRLTDENLYPLAQAAFTRHRWQREALRGAVVQFVLDSPGDHKRRPLNDRQALERFWRLVFTNVGADLRSFDSRIGE
jgi:hypothetical protein